LVLNTIISIFATTSYHKPSSLSGGEPDRRDCSPKYTKTVGAGGDPVFACSTAGGFDTLERLWNKLVV
jgi:hypothetical protein